MSLTIPLSENSHNDHSSTIKIFRGINNSWPVGSRESHYRNESNTYERNEYKSRHHSNGFERNKAYGRVSNEIDNERGHERRVTSDCYCPYNNGHRNNDRDGYGTHFNQEVR